MFPCDNIDAQVVRDAEIALDEARFAARRCEESIGPESRQALALLSIAHSFTAIAGLLTGVARMVHDDQNRELVEQERQMKIQQQSREYQEKWRL